MNNLKATGKDKEYKLSDLTKIRTGKLDANANDPEGEYPFFTCSRDALRINSYSYDCECVLVAGNGELNVKYYKGKFDAYQRTYIVESIDKSIIKVPFIYRFLSIYVETLQNQAIGGVIKYIKLENLTQQPLFKKEQ
ncbi:MAG TPA: restriction endonuclease subunit S [Bacilli bacterium]|nr:restriction endonuclease subunit S [Bacilli bacterium]